MWKHYLAGIMPGLVIGGIAKIFSHGGFLILAILSIPGKLIAGFIGHIVHLVANKKSYQLPQPFTFVRISLVLGTLSLFITYYLIGKSCLFC